MQAELHARYVVRLYYRARVQLYDARLGHEDLGYVARPQIVGGNDFSQGVDGAVDIDGAAVRLEPAAGCGVAGGSAAA
jgi:hypothetical protein